MCPVPSPILHHLFVGDDAAPNRMLVLPGIYGAGRNWATFARGLTIRRPEWGVILIDLRLHGHSQRFPTPHTLSNCVHDLVVLAHHLGVRVGAVLGHSFGGKVALMSAVALHPKQVWVIDSTPSRRTPGGSAYRMLQILRRLPRTFESRREAVETLRGEGYAADVAQWMGTNLESTGGRCRWRFDLDEMEELLDDFFRRDLWDVVESPPEPTRIHFVRASESDAMPLSEYTRAREAGGHGRVSVHELHGGHWLHQDNPEGLLALVAEQLAANG